MKFITFHYIYCNEMNMQRFILYSTTRLPALQRKDTRGKPKTAKRMLADLPNFTAGEEARMSYRNADLLLDLCAPGSLPSHRFQISYP